MVLTVGRSSDDINSTSKCFSLVLMLERKSTNTNRHYSQCRTAF